MHRYQEYQAQNNQRIRSGNIRPWATLTAIILPLFLFGLSRVEALTFVEPNSPLGATVGAPLNSSGSTQRKAGSLVIDGFLCLNTNVETTDPNFCLDSWDDIGAITSGFVRLNSNDWTIPPPNPPGPVVAQTGYIRIKASSASNKNQLYSIIAEAPEPILGASTAIYAYVPAGFTGSFAGYFNGNTYFGDGTTTSVKKLCLNDTDDYVTDPNQNDKGCITSWRDVTDSLSGNYVLLQATPGPLSLQSGGQALNGAGIFSAASTPVNGGEVLGVPADGPDLCFTCGDGLCVGPAETGGPTGNCRAGFQPAGCPNIPASPGGDCSAT